MSVAADIAEDATRDILEAAGKDAMEAAINDAIKGAEEAAANLLKGRSITINQQMINIIVERGVTTVTNDAIANAMKDILKNEGRTVATQITELAERETVAAQTEIESAVTNAVEKAPQTTEAELTKIGKDIASKADYNYGKLSGTIMKYTACAAIASLMLKDFIGKLNHVYKVKQISVDSDGDTITFLFCDSGNFTPGDSFKCSDFKAPYESMNDNSITITQSSTDSIKINKEKYPNFISSDGTTFNCNNFIGKMTCSPDLSSNLAHSTGEVLNNWTDAAGDVIKHTADDLGITGFLGSFGTAFKWIIIGAAIIFVLILLLWIYKQFKG